CDGAGSRCGARAERGKAWGQIGALRGHEASKADHARRRVPLQREKRADPAALYIAGARGERCHPAGRARHDPGIHSGAETAAASARPRSAEVIRRLVPLPGRVTANWLRYGCAIAVVAVACPIRQTCLDAGLSDTTHSVSWL